MIGHEQCFDIKHSMHKLWFANELEVMLVSKAGLIVNHDLSF